MRITVNGEAHEHQGRGAIGELLQELRADPARVAIMVNGEVLPRTRWDSVTLSESDQVELLAFAGGG